MSATVRLDLKKRVLVMGVVNAPAFRSSMVERAESGVETAAAAKTR